MTSRVTTIKRECKWNGKWCIKFIFNINIIDLLLSCRIREREKRDTEDGSESKKEDDTENINLEQKMQIFTNERKFLVLKFFLTHFIEMTERSNKFRHRGQAYLYMQMSKIVLNRIKVNIYALLQYKLILSFACLSNHIHYAKFS